MLLRMDLVSIEELRRLKYRYFRTLDLKLWDDFADTLAEDIEGRYGTKVYGEALDLIGREAVVDFMREKLTNDVVTMHVAQHPELEVDGDEATGSWAFEDTVIVPSFMVLIRLPPRPKCVRRIGLTPPPGISIGPGTPSRSRLRPESSAPGVRVR